MTPLQRLLRTLLLAGAGLVGTSGALARDADLQGRWVIAKATLAPWADPRQRGGGEEETRLVGRTVSFGPRSVAGPQPLACAHAIYSAHDDTPDLLFEGGLAEPDQSGKPRDAAALARKLGMTTRTVLTVETGCSEVAYHRLSRDTFVFGLNNRIYTLRPAPKPRP